MATEAGTPAKVELNKVGKATGCYACGVDNARGLHLHFEHTAPFTAEARAVALTDYEGWTGVMHGGITFTLMDEAFGWCLYYEGVSAVTAKVETRFLKPVPTGAQLRVKAWVTENRRRLFTAAAHVVDDKDGTVYAEATATMMRVHGEVAQ
jgi:uncharacterized protein (TIGR00369 family)